MKSSLHITLCLAALCAFTTARAGTPDIPDDINARIARTKSQQASEVAARLRAGDTSVAAFGANGAGSTPQALGNGCNIAIGNVFEDKAAIGTSAKRETTVIVTGDVIQVGNNCR